MRKHITRLLTTLLALVMLLPIVVQATPVDGWTDEAEQAYQTVSKSNKLTEQLRAVKQAKSRILNQDGDDTIPCTQELITILKRGPETLHDFDGELFGQLIDKVIIESNTSLRFRLKNGLELRESIERTVR